MPADIDSVISSLLMAERDSFLSPMKPTPYGHSKFVWFKAGKTARLESRASGFTFMEDSLGILINDAAKCPHQITFTLLGSAARDAISRTEENIVKCLPDSCVQDFLNFRWELITDDAMLYQSIFRQPQNQDVLHPIRNKLLNLLLAKQSQKDRGKPLPLTFCTGQLDIPKARTWLQTHDAILSSITAAFILTCGIPPRDFQFKSFQVDHDEDKGYKRSFFIIDKLPAFANPKAKQVGQDFKPCLWGVTSVQARSLLFFLGILKPVYATIMSMMNIHDKIFDTYIFVHTIPLAQSQSTSHPLLLSGTTINYCLYKHTSSIGIRLTCGVMRNMITAVYHQFFPWLMTSADSNPGERSAVDLQGQHQALTGTVHYGRILDVPLALDMCRNKVVMFIQVSRALQSIYGLAPVDENWGDHHEIQQSPYILAKFREATAFAKAQSLICIHYGLGGDCDSTEGRSRNLKVVNCVLSAAPYLQRPSSEVCCSS